jgi:hypothetical protein
VREAKNTAFRGWIGGSNAHSRAFFGWVILTPAHGNIWELEGIVSAVTSASIENITLDQGLYGISVAIVESTVRLHHVHRISLTELIAEKDLVYIEADEDVGDDLAAMVNIVGTIEALAETLQAILAEIDETDEEGARIAIASYVPASRRTIQAGGSLRRKTSIVAKR